jgi:uncharacterized Fe-S cluster protein YjdI
MTDIETYETDVISVTYDPAVCVHGAECVRGLPEVFNADAQPWIQPQNADPSAVAEQVKRCPSGALQYQFLKQSQ